MKIEVNMSPGEQIARMIVALPLSIPIVYLGWAPLFFLPIYIAVTGICGIALEYTLFKKEKPQAKQIENLPKEVEQEEEKEEEVLIG